MHREASDSTLYTGPSMSPTLKSLDMLRVIPYDGRRIRPGDVVVFRPPGRSRKIAHRVISVDPGGIRTRGDNCLLADAWVLTPDSILGRVVYADRGKRRVRIHGGWRGRMWAFGPRLLVISKTALCLLIRPMYRLLARSGLGRRLFPIESRTRIVRFNRSSGAELQLLLGQRVIATRSCETGRWNIKPPFRLFIDERTLPG